ncbi:MAG: conjugal transfer protein TraB [Candidatus Moraniibacteriota bacterium]|nr:MAG: conjugal transfer protein TraB [Candidatus Moranbacteria bacterium]
MRVLAIGGGAILLLGSYYILGDDGSAEKTDVETAVNTVGVDDMVNRNMSEKEWMSRSEARFNELENKQRSMQGAMMGPGQNGLGPAGAMPMNPGYVPPGGEPDQETKNIISAYQQENAQLKAAVAAAKASPVMQQGGPNGLYGPGAPPTYANGGKGGPATAAGSAALAAVGGSPVSMRGNNIQLLSFGEGASGNATPVAKGSTTYTDSANYLPPNSIASAKVIVGVDAAAGVQSQTDPLPVVLRITGPARSVYENGRLLTTNISGCLVNGAARGDLSSEKVYVKLQRMTCPQANGRFAVADVKGFIAFGGKTGVRGRVVSREGSLVGQALLAGIAEGFGKGFSANTQSLLSGTNVSVDGKRDQLSTSDILQGGFGNGVATGGEMVSKYLIERAEQYQPVIEMPTGIDVEIVFLDGVFINN